MPQNALGHLCHCGVLLAGIQLVHQDPKLFLYGAVPQKLSVYWCMGLLLCIGRTSDFPFHIPLCPVPPCADLHFLQYFLSLNLLRVHFSLLSRFLMKRLNNTGLRIKQHVPPYPWGTPPVRCLQLHFVLWITSPWAWLFSNTESSSLSIYQTHTMSPCLQDCYRSLCQRPS